MYNCNRSVESCFERNDLEIGYLDMFPFGGFSC